MRRLAAIIALPVFLASPAGLAQDTGAQTGAVETIGRYTIVPYENGVIRVDRTTGAVDSCRKTLGKLACELAADERRTWQRETESLSDTVSALEKRIARLERDGLPNGTTAPNKKKSIETVEEMEEAWTMAETFFRRFFDLVETLKSDREKSNDL